MSNERRYVVRFTLTHGQVAVIPFSTLEPVHAGDLIMVAGWRVSVESVVEEATERTAGLLSGHVVRKTQPLGPKRLKRPSASH